MIFSIIIPLFNSEKFIGETIRSVQAQTVTDWEMIIIDDYSTDSSFSVASEEALRDKRIRVYRNETNMGVASTRNKGLELTNGKYIALLDADDIWLPFKLEKQLEVFKQTGCKLCCTSYEFIDVNSNLIKDAYIVPEDIGLKVLLKENVIGCSTAAFERRITEGHRFTQGFMHEDYVFWLDILKDGIKAAGVRQTCVRYRVHSGGRSYGKVKAAKNRWLVLRKHMKLNIILSAYYFAFYGIRGVRKHFGRQK